MAVNGLGHQSQNVRGAAPTPKSVNQANVSQQRVAQERKAIEADSCEFLQRAATAKEKAQDDLAKIDGAIQNRVKLFAALGPEGKAEIKNDIELKQLLRKQKVLKAKIQLIDKSVAENQSLTDMKIKVGNLKAALTNQVMSALNGGEVSFNSRSSLGKALKDKEVVDVKFENLQEVQQKKGLKTETGIPADIVLEGGKVLKALVHKNDDGTYEIHGMKK